MQSRPKATPRLRLDGSRQRWWILLLVLVAYLSTHRYSWTIGIVFAFDLVVNYARSGLFWYEWGDPPAVRAASAAADFALRAATVVVGATVNAFVAYVYDLTFFEGTPYLYLGLVALMYLWAALVEGRGPTDAIYAVGGAAPRTQPQRDAAEDARAARRIALDTAAPLRTYADYVLIFGGSVIAALTATGVFIFAEPYTLLYFYGYAVSVFFLVLIRHLTGREWQPLAAFLAFWLVGLGFIGAMVLLPSLRHKHAPSQYFL